MTEATDALNNIVTARWSNNQDQAKKALMQYTNEVAWQESKAQNIPQIGGGPGRGYFQYEMPSVGGSGANITAVNRAYNWFNDQGKEVPQWINDLKGKNVDFTTLSKSQQNALFLYDTAKNPKAKLDSLVQSYGTKNWEQVSEKTWRDAHNTRSDTKWVGSQVPKNGHVMDNPSTSTIDQDLKGNPQKQTSNSEPQPEYYRDKYEKLSTEIQQNPAFADASSRDVDLGVALSVLKENEQSQSGEGLDQANTEVAGVLSQSDQVKQWKESLEPADYQEKSTAYIEDIHNDAQEIYQDHLNPSQQETLG